MQIENNKTGNLVAGQETINAPAGAVFIRGIQVYDSTSAITGPNIWLEKERYNIFTRVYFHLLLLQKEGNQNTMLCLEEPQVEADYYIWKDDVVAPVPDTNL